MLTKKQMRVRDLLTVVLKLAVTLRFLEWKTVSEVFANKWNYHNCGGSPDGKNVPIKKLRKGGSLYYSYKEIHNIILMAETDANYKFGYVDIGAEGGAGDGGTQSKYNLHHALEQNRAGFPEDSTLLNDHSPIPSP
ncbi:uncharacterized protein [Palaemon carinicauda]|uniref:uncharacterized protein n=1 Tax=Palaemon carinicauda TaxID=392227 RepID=UPI0035B660AA